jgi:hypothetical protein
MEGSKFSLTSLSEMKTDDVKNSYCSETTRVHIGRKDYTNSIKINWSWYNLILYCQSLLIICRGKKLKKITMGSSLSIIHSSNGQMTSSDYRYCDRACLAATQSSNERRDVGVPLLLGVQNVAFESSCQNRDAHRHLIRHACQSLNVGMGMNLWPIAIVILKRRAPLSRHLFEYATDSGYKMLERHSLSLSSNRPLSPSLKLSSPKNGIQRQ